MSSALLFYFRRGNSTLRRIWRKRLLCFCFLWAVWASVAAYGFKPIWTDDGDGNAPASAVFREWNFANHETPDQLFGGSGVKVKNIRGGGSVFTNQTSSVTCAEKRLADWRAGLCLDANISGVIKEREGFLDANRSPIFKPVEKYLVVAPVFAGMPSISELAVGGINFYCNRPLEVGGGLGYVAGFSPPCYSLDVIERLASLTGVTEIHSATAKIVNFASSPRSINGSVRFLKAGLGIGGDVDEVAHNLHNDLSGTTDTGKHNKHKPRYMRMTAEHEAIDGRSEQESYVFEIDRADIDVSYDGKRWFHFTGGPCVKHEPPFREK